MNATQKAIHQEAVGLAGQYKRCQSRLIEILQKADAYKVFRALEYNSLFDYAVRGLGLSEGCACNLIQVSRKAKEVPELKRAIDSGELTVSKARRLAPVITPHNQASWIELAQQLPQRELERKVAEVRPECLVKERIKPVAAKRCMLVCGISQALEKKIQRAKDLLSQSQRASASLEQTLEAAVNLYLEKKDPVARAKRAAQHKKPPTKKGEEHGERQIARSGHPRPAIPAPIANAVRVRDGGQCTHRDATGRRCTSQRFVELHHLVPMALGGAHTVGNLTTLCFHHHRRIHEQLAGLLPRPG